MPAASRPSFAVLALLFVQVACQTPPLPRLEPGYLSTRHIEAGEIHRYVVDLEAHRYVSIAVDQRSEVDVAVRFLAPDGEQILRVDSLNNEHGIERIRAISAQSGTHVVEVRLFAGSSGSYGLSFEQKRPPTERERALAAAELAFEKADSTWYDSEQATREALARFRQLVDVWHAWSDPRVEVGWFRVGFAHDRLGEIEDAVDAFEQLRGLLAARDDRSERFGYVLHFLGFWYAKLGQIDLAEERYRAAVAMQREHGDLSAAAASANGLAVFTSEQSQYEEPLDLFTQSIALADRAGALGEKSRYTKNRGYHYLEWNQPELAEVDLRTALAIDTSLGDVKGKGAGFNGLGQVYFEHGDLDRAELYLRASVLAYRTANESTREAVALSYLAFVLEERGQVEQAEDLLLQAKAIHQERNETVQLATLKVRLAKLQEINGHYEEALANHRAALPVFSQMQDPFDEAAALFGIARCLRGLGDLQGALVHMEQALSKVEVLRRRPSNFDLRSLFFADRHINYQRYTDLLVALDTLEPGSGYDTRAFASSERSKARTLLDALTVSTDTSTHDSDGSDRSAEALRVLEERVDVAYRDLSASAGEDEAARRVLRQQLERALDDLLRARGRSRVSVAELAALAADPIGVAEVQRDFLDHDTVLLEYALGEERSFLWIVSKDSMATHVLPPAAEIEAVTRDAYLLLRQSYRPSEWRRLRPRLRQLSDLLLAPVADQLIGKRILIVGDAALHYVPFGALPWPDSAGEGRSGLPLIETNEVVNAPSATVLALIRNRNSNRPAATGRVAIIADPVFSSTDSRWSQLPEGNRPAFESALGARGLPRLEATAGEAGAIRELVPPDRRFEALGLDARVELFEDERLHGYDILHLATHGKIDMQNPQLSRLVFSQFDRQGRTVPGSLYVHQLFRLDLPVRLVVLSACDTALGGEIRGEGLVGMTQGFLYAGAPRLVVSLWPVEDSATAELMRHFYRVLLQEGESPSAALRKAQREIRQTPRWRSPYFWASMQLQGDWQSNRNFQPHR